MPSVPLSIFVGKVVELFVNMIDDTPTVPSALPLPALTSVGPMPITDRPAELPSCDVAPLNVEGI